MDLNEHWDKAIVDFCRTRYPLSLQPLLVRTSTDFINNVYHIVEPDELHDTCAWLPLEAIYEQGVVKCYAIGRGNGYYWRNPNTGEEAVNNEFFCGLKSADTI